VKVFLRFIAMLAVLIQSGVTYSHAGVVTFGTGANQFQMEFVTIGNPGNAADTGGFGFIDPRGAGGIGYTYSMGKFEVSREMVEKYNAEYGISSNRVIGLADMTPYGGNGPNKPATNVNWNEAAQFVNWLNISTGNAPAYKFTTNQITDISLWEPSDTLDYDPTNLYRSKRTKYVLPTCSEWYKAAYYNPITQNYHFYPNGSETPPISVASGTTNNTAVYGEASLVGPADTTQSGGLSPYGVMGLGGNVYEWDESSTDLNNSSGDAPRGIRGGAWSVSAERMSSYYGRLVHTVPPGFETHFIGFRVAMLSPAPSGEVPEPSMMVIGTLFGLGGLLAKRRIKR
jgi:hypothetical protein